MKTSLIRQKLYEYIYVVDDIKLKALYAILQHDIEQWPDYDRWNDEEFVAEMVKRSEDLQSGKVKGIPLQEALKTIRESYKNENAIDNS